MGTTYTKDKIKTGITYNIRVTGSTFREGVQEILKTIVSYINMGRVERNAFYTVLEREKDNEYDPNAIKVILGKYGSSKTYHVGYIPAFIAKDITEVMESQERCIEVVDTLFLGDGTNNTNVGIEIKIKAVKTKDEQ